MERLLPYRLSERFKSIVMFQLGGLCFPGAGVTAHCDHTLRVRSWVWSSIDLPPLGLFPQYLLPFLAQVFIVFQEWAISSNPNVEWLLVARYRQQ